MIRAGAIHDRQDLRELQARWDAEAARDAMRPRPGAPSLCESWQGLLHDATRGERRDLGCLICMTAPLLTLFAALWWMLPA